MSRPEALAPVVALERPELAWFASDMHLDDGAAHTGRFLEALSRLPERCPEPGAALFLLGDLFEVWVGDDIAGPAADALAQALSALRGLGWRVFIQHGNRDFLMGVPVPGVVQESWFSRSSATWLPDPSVITVAGERIVLTHGDALCLADTRYQAWRRQCREPSWQQAQLAHPANLRQQMGRAARAHSQAAQAGTDRQAVPGGDVDLQAVQDLLAEQDATVLVHGHTHRPALHGWRAPAGGPNAGVACWRWVLSDWDASLRGSIDNLADGLRPD